MKIAQIAPLMESVPPRLYGGSERIVSYLTDELVRQGHDVTLFASGDSVSSANLVRCVPMALRLDANVRDPIPYYMLMLDRVRELADEFDILHFHIDQFHFPAVSADRQSDRDHPARPAGPARPQAALCRLQRHAAGIDLQFTAKADRQRQFRRHRLSRHSRARLLKPTYKPSGDYVAFLGRISPEKRPDRAIRIAQALGVPIKIAAKVDKVDEAYFRETIAPLFNQPGVEYIGEIDERSKSEFLGEASALLFPIDWPEPFGLSMIEAMACGTPVLAFRCGSVPEIIDPGVTGMIVDTMDEAIRVLPQVLALDRRAVRQRFEQRFSAARMAKDYVQVYRSLIKQQALPERDAPVSRRQPELEQGMN